jgi:hypothetical protein
LGETSRFTPRFEQFAQLLVAFGVDGFGNLGSPLVGLPIKIALEDSPKMGEYGFNRNSRAQGFEPRRLTADVGPSQRSVPLQCMQSS